jgi:hypothetical protein
VFVRTELDSEATRALIRRRLGCGVTLADGSSLTIDPNKQRVLEETSIGTSIGTFSGLPGRTTVLCEWRSASGLVLENYVVTVRRTATKIAIWSLIGVGAVLTSVGAWLLAIGIRGRAVIERVPV